MNILRLRIYHNAFYSLLHAFCFAYLTLITCTVYLNILASNRGLEWGFIILLASFAVCNWRKKVVLYLHLLNTKLYSYQNLSLRFILKIFLKLSCKFQPQYSYKIYSHKKNKSAVKV